MEGLEIRVLGGIALERDGGPVSIGGPKPRLVLALLAARAGEVVSVDRICEELWGDEQPVDPAGVLQSHVSRLRRLLRPEVEIVGRPPGYVLEAADRAVDARRFEALCDTARRSADPALAVDRFIEALACWRGDAFEEFAESDWARIEAARLAELRSNAREDLIEARLALGEHAELVGELEALTAEHPLRERLHQQLVVALYRSGRTPEALRHADAYRTHVRDELGLDPSPAFRDLEAGVLNEDPGLLATAAAPRRSRTRRLPAETTALVGRATDLEHITERVRRERLVTLTGPGGVGKTRLARRVALDCFDELAGEVFVVELAPVRDPGSTIAAIATVVDVQQRQHLSVEETLVQYLRSQRALLVLDNCEHLVGAVAPLVDRILGLCPEVTVLATSREVLGLPSEQVYRVGPLGVDVDGSAAVTAPAVELFVARAAAASPGFDPDSDDLVAIGEIVHRIDGLPLAIELAAARVRAMSPAALAERLDGRFEILDASQAARVERHRSLTDLVAWSYELLVPDEQRLFGRLGVFAGTFGLDAAEGVCGDDTLGPTRVSLLLANLVDKSMVQMVDGPGRYRLLETLREYGRCRLDDAEHAAVRERHARWYLALAEQSAHDLAGPEEPSAVETLDWEFDNLRAAYGFAVEVGDVDLGLRLVAALREYGFRCMHAEVAGWAGVVAALPGADEHERYPVVLAAEGYGMFVRGDLEAAIEVGERAMDAAARLGVDGSGLAERTLGNALFYLGESEQAVAWIERLVESGRQGSSARLAHALYMRSVAHTSLGEYVKGAQRAGEADATARASGSPTARAEAEYALGLALESANPDEASEHLQNAVELARSARNRWIEAFALTEVLWLRARQGEPRDALAGYADVVDLWYRGGDWANQWLSLRHVFGILVPLRDHLGAATLHGALSAAGAAYALPFQAADAEHLSALVDAVRAQMGPAPFAAAVRRGASLCDRDIVEFALDRIHALSGPSTASAVVGSHAEGDAP